MIRSRLIGSLAAVAILLLLALLAGGRNDAMARFGVDPRAIMSAARCRRCKWREHALSTPTGWAPPA